MPSRKQVIGGVQSWSVGEVYPYHIVVRGSSPGVVYAQGPSGKLAEHPFTSCGTFNPVTKQMEGGDFKQAHRKAVVDARRQLYIDQTSAVKVAV